MIFEEFVKNQPLLSIIIFSLIITFVLTLIYKIFTPQNRTKELREEQKKIQGQIKVEKDSEKMMALQEELLKKSAELMRLTMKPMFITLILIWPTFIFLKNLYTTAKVGAIIPWRFNLPILCSWLPGLCDGAGWLLSYAILSMIFSIILRKIMKVH